MTAHPLADLLPMIECAHWSEFVGSIKASGLIEPIVTHEGMILDGRNRYRACSELGIAPAFKAYEGTDPLGFVLAANLHRRHLTAKQRAAMAAELANLEHGTNRYAKKVEAQICASSKITIEAAAKMMNVSPRSVDTAKRRMRDDPESHAAVKAGHKVHKAPAAAPSASGQDKELQHRRALFDQEVREIARAQLPEEVKALRAARERADGEFKKYAAMRKGIPAQMTEADYKFLLNVLHPDRAPEDRREKFARAFDIVRQLDAYIKAFKA